MRYLENFSENLKQQKSAVITCNYNVTSSDRHQNVFTNSRLEPLIQCSQNKLAKYRINYSTLSTSCLENFQWPVGNHPTALLKRYSLLKFF